MILPFIGLGIYILGGGTSPKSTLLQVQPTRLLTQPLMLSAHTKAPTPVIRRKSRTFWALGGGGGSLPFPVLENHLEKNSSGICIYWFTNVSM
jgi:tetrahydromethanopterin S-methyltransferase subunit D